MLWRQCRHAFTPRAASTRRRSGSPAKLSKSPSGHWLNWHGDALCDLAEVLAASGRTDEAAATLDEALERYERKARALSTWSGPGRSRTSARGFEVRRSIR